MAVNKRFFSWLEFRDPSGVVPTWMALAYSTIGYALGVWLLTLSSIAANTVGVLLTAHALVIAAYLLHEFAHYSIFRQHSANDRFGSLMGWITGACYARFDDLRRKHLRHHADRADIVTFDYRKFLRGRPGWVRKLVYALEWAYVPAVELIMHGFVIALPFFSSHHKHHRARVITVLAARLAFFGAIGWYAPRSVFLYSIAYLLMLTVLRFIDAFQHTYVAYPILANGEMPDVERRDKEYEYRNTYTNLLSVKHPWLNLLTLNFVYHNAHHAKPSAAWHRLPEVHRELYGEGDPQVLPLGELLRTFHRNRVVRVLNDGYGRVTEGPGRTKSFVGAIGVGVLTAV